MLIHFEFLRQEGQPQKLIRPQGSRFAVGRNPLTPLASLCLGVVRGWINVARRGRGGQIDEQGTAWTRLPAEELRDQLAREFLVEVSTRSVQRALKELETAQQIRREQRWKHRYKRDYWYAIPEHEEALEALRPRTIAGNYQSSRQAASDRVEATPVAGQVLSTPFSKTHFSKSRSSNGSTRGQRSTPAAGQQGTTGTRKRTHMDAVAACLAMGKRTQGAGQETSGGWKGYPKHTPEEVKTVGAGSNSLLKSKKTSGGKGFGANGPTDEHDLRVMSPTSSDQASGRITREVWVGGRCYAVSDDVRTAPIQ